MARKKRLQDPWIASAPDADFQSLVAEIGEPVAGTHQRGDRVTSAQRAAEDVTPGSPVGAQQNDLHADLFKFGRGHRAR